jgi:hypothetical protein
MGLPFISKWMGSSLRATFVGQDYDYWSRVNLRLVSVLHRIQLLPHQG